MQRSFEFVNVSGQPNPRNEEYRHNVRVKSMKAFRRNERLQRKGQTALQKTTPSGSEPDGNEHDKSGAHQDSDGITLVTRRPSETIINLGSSLMDPFLTTALPLTAARQILVRTFIRDVDRVLLPTPGSKDISGSSWTIVWMHQALSSPLLLCAICCHASTYQDMVARKGTTLLTLQTLQETFEFLQQALREKVDTVSNEMIGAVVMLMANTYITGYREDLVSHNLALRDMLTTRGENVRGTPFGDVLDQALGWHVAPTTLLLQQLVKREGKSLLDILAKPAASHLISSRDLPSLIESFHHLVLEFNKLATEGKTTAELTAFSDARVALEYGIVQYWDALPSAQTHPIETMSSTTRDVKEAMCAALLIQSTTKLRNFSIRAPSVKSGLQLLVQILKRIDVDPTEQWSVSDLDSLLWITAVARSGELSSDDENMVDCLAKRATKLLGSIRALPRSD